MGGTSLTNVVDLFIRFDLLIGYNELEAGFVTAMILTPLVDKYNQTLEDGISLELALLNLNQECSDSYTPNIELCREFLVNLYDIDGVNDKQRYLQLAKQKSWFYYILNCPVNAFKVDQM